jgi:hypothetical protein
MLSFQHFNLSFLENFVVCWKPLQTIYKLLITSTKILQWVVATQDILHYTSHLITQVIKFEGNISTKLLLLNN